MFNYESVTGHAFIKDSYNRLKSYQSTDKGIKLMIPNISKEMDLGKDTGRGDNQKQIEVKEIVGQLLFCLD